jgi:nicotinate-nucleotide adenylyltransferase
VRPEPRSPADRSATDERPVGVLGGTFDPIHIAHLRLAHEAWELLELAHVRFIPSARPPHRDAPHASAAQRLAMVELAIAGHPGFVADARELERNAPSYTVDTLESLRADLGSTRPVCLLVGADAFVQLETWHRWPELFALAHIVVAHRPGCAPENWAAHMGKDLAGEFEARRSQSVQALRQRPAGQVVPMPITQLDISASAVRALLAAGREPRYLIPETVLGYIGRNHLYGKPHAD